MATMLDSATVLMAQNTYSTSQSLPGILVYPRQLATTNVIVQLTVPPAASTVFAAEVASTQNGVYSEIGRMTWPAGLVGNQVASFGVNVSLAQRLNTTALWLRLNVTTSGAFTGTAFLSKASDGSFGLASARMPG